MSNDLSFTGERFVPGTQGEIVYEHVHRYAFARELARGRVVLDAACGEGYGSALLASSAREVIGVDVDAAAVAHATARYASCGNLRFLQGSVAALPMPDASVDLVVSFETIEHLPAQDQPVMLAEFARVLRPSGSLLISSPNRPQYSDARDYRNPFHVHELDRDELAALLAPRFPAQRWYRQRLWMGSTLWAESGAGAHAAWTGSPEAVDLARPPEAMYFVVHAAAHEQALAEAAPALSMFSDDAETEIRRAEAHAREAMRLDALAGERLAALDRQSGHVAHLERLAVERLEALDRQTGHIEHLERIAVERLAALEQRTAQIEQMEKLLANREALLDQTRSALAGRERELAELRRDREGAASECQRLERALTAQERIIAHRQSLRWWFELPWLRAKLWWHRLLGA